MTRKITLLWLLCLLSVSSVLFAQDESTAGASIEERTYTGVISDETDGFYQDFPLEITAISNVTLDMNPTGSNGLDDTLVKLIDRQNLVIAENDDVDTEGGDFTSFLEVQHLQPGDYRIIATRYKEADGEKTGAFELNITIEPVQAPAPYDITDDDLDENGFPAIEPRETADWTILAYYGADTNLEKDVINDLNEFELAGGSSSNVRIIALMDRLPHADGGPDWSTARLFEVTADVSGDEANYPASPPTIDSTVLRDLGEVDTGQGETLARFLVWGVQNFPAEHYAVAFSSHGAAWRGLISDETSNDSHLDVPELRRAFEQGIEAAGVEKFDLLINDACLMSSVEYYTEMSKFFHVTLGSPEIVVSPALNMTIFAEALKENADVSLDSLGRRLIDTYVNVDAVNFGGGNAAYYTGVVTNLDRFDNLTSAVHDFAEFINRRPDLYTPIIGQARRNTYTYAAFMGFKSEIDLGDFMEQIISLTSDEELQAQADKVLESLSTVRVHGNAGAIALSRASYYSIYFPETVRDFEDDYYEETPLTEWGQMLRNYYTYAAFNRWAGSGDEITFHAPASPDVRITRVYPEAASFDFPISISMEVVGNNISRGYFTVDQVVDDSTRIRFSQQPILKNVPTEDGADILRNQNVWDAGVDSRNLQWNATSYQVSDGANTNFEFLQQSLDGSDTFFLSGLYRASSEDDWQSVRIIFSADPTNTFDLRQASIVSVAENGSTGVIQPQQGSQFRSFQTILNQSGEVTNNRFEGNLYDMPIDDDAETTDGLVANLMPVASGDYILNFEIVNFSGQTDRAPVTVSVNNDDVTAGIRGQNLVQEFRFKGVVPVTWSDLEIENNVAYVDNYTQPVKENTRFDGFMIVVYYVAEDVDGSEESLQTAIDSAVRWATIGEVPNEFSTGDTTTISGLPATEFTYTVTDYQAGQGIQIYDEATQTAYMVMAVDWSGQTELLSELYQLLKTETGIFNDLPEDQREWQTVNASEELQLPIRESWMIVDAVQEGWTTYSPSEGSATFAAFRVLEDPTESVAILQSIISGAGEIGDPVQFYGQSATWDAIEYTTSRDETEVAGRLYTTIANGRSYIAWFETPVLNAASIYPDTMETMLSGVDIKDLFYVVDLSEQLGITLNRPGTQLPDNPWGGRNYSPDLNAMVFNNFNGSERLEVVQYPNTDIEDPVELATALAESVEGLTLADDPQIVTVDTREVAEFDILYDLGGTEWYGRYFATYDEQRDLGLIIGFRAIGDNTDYLDHYADMTERMVFTEGEYYPFTPIEKQVVYNSTYGFTVDVPALWQTFELDINRQPGIDRYWSTDGANRVEIYIDGNSGQDIQSTLQTIYEDEDELPELVMSDLQTATVSGYLGLAYFADTVQFFAVLDEQREQVFIVRLYNPDGADREMYDTLLSSFNLLSLSD